MTTLEDQDKRFLIHPFTPIAAQQDAGPHVMTEGRGIFIEDADGREYIDGMAGLWCVNAGYGREEIVDAIAGQARRLPYYHGFLSMATEPTIRAAKRLADLAPGRLNRVFFSNSGSEANDTSIKVAWYYNNLRGKCEKKKIIARKRAYHGVTLGAGSLSGLPRLHAGFDAPVSERFLHVSAPYPYRDAPAGASEEEYSALLAQELEDRIQAEGPDTVAAFIAEPVMGAGGVLVPPKGYFAAIAAVLRKYDVLLIADEVICGFGRLGAAFGSDYFGIAPDLMTVAKGLTSGYVPMSASILSDDVWQVLSDGSAEMGAFAHGFTYSGHPVAAAAALANLDLMEKDGWIENARETGAHMQQRLRESLGEHPLVGDVRGLGLVAGIELVANKETRARFDPKRQVGLRLHHLLQQEGLISRALGDTMALSPPLVITKAEVDEIIRRFARGLARLYDELP